MAISYRLISLWLGEKPDQARFRGILGKLALVLPGLLVTAATVDGRRAGFAYTEVRPDQINLPENASEGQVGELELGLRLDGHQTHPGYYRKGRVAPKVGHRTRVRRSIAALLGGLVLGQA